ncbi:hypothetical protein [Tropicibacter sp. S64]|uniref:hypothetical protein n=1 Tax=Tropicibacter sp. S64 TaxID=3415122 RepID=UPI003C7CE460
MPSLARIWGTHALAMLAGAGVAYGALAVLSKMLISGGDDWVGALGKLLALILVAAPLGMLAYAAVVRRVLGLRFGARGWIGFVVVAVAAAAVWLWLAVRGTVTPVEGLVLMALVLFIAGGVFCTRAVRSGR